MKILDLKNLEEIMYEHLGFYDYEDSIEEIEMILDEVEGETTAEEKIKLIRNEIENVRQIIKSYEDSDEIRENIKETVLNELYLKEVK